MTHVRTQIREAAVAALRGGPLCGANVFAGRTWPLGRAQLPALLVYTRDERSSRSARSSAAQNRLERLVELVVEAQAQAAADSPDIEAGMDALAAFVENRIAGAATIELGRLVFDVVLDSTRTDFSQEGEVKPGTIRLTFLATYHTPDNDPETTLL